MPNGRELRLAPGTWACRARHWMVVGVDSSVHPFPHTHSSDLLSPDPTDPPDPLGDHDLLACLTMTGTETRSIVLVIATLFLDETTIQGVKDVKVIFWWMLSLPLHILIGIANAQYVRSPSSVYPAMLVRYLGFGGRMLQDCDKAEHQLLDYYLNR